MASRPAKRQRRSTVVLSDEDDALPEPGSLPVRTSIRSKPVKGEADDLDSQPTTPRKRPAKPGLSPAASQKSPAKASKSRKSKPDVPNKSLHSFFSRATEEQRWHRRSQTPDVGSEIDNVIEDDIVDEGLPESSSQAQPGSLTQQPSSRTAARHLHTARATAVPSSSQKFVRPATSTTQSTAEPVASEAIEEPQQHKPWADRYGPNNLAELAIHKKKVSDVQNWLENVLSGREQKRLLVLKGAAGSGKTSTVTLVAEAIGATIVPWHNATTYESGTASNVQQFNDFLNRGGQFGSLTLRDDGRPLNSGVPTGTRLILIEEFPTTSARSSNVLEVFRSALLEYIESGRPVRQPGTSSLHSHPPIVMIISETLISSSTALADSFTAHRLLGPVISNHPLTTIIEFNPVAPTFVQKALELVVKKEARDSGRKRTPGRPIFQRLAEIGDLRSAVNSLEFLCARGDNPTDWSGTVATRSKKNDNVTLTDTEKNALHLVGMRESTLDMFHAAGKIVYNKREDPRVADTRAAPPPKPPDHLSYLHRPKVSQVDIETLLNETGTDIQTFISTLHENYVLSCNGDDFVDALDDCADQLSVSDVLNPESRGLIRAKGNSGSSARQAQVGNFDMLRQDEISFHTACRGLLFSLPFPVTRASPPGMRKQDAFKMFYPTSLRLWRPAEEVYDLISLYHRAGLDVLEQANTVHQSKGVASWRSRAFAAMESSTSADVSMDMALPPSVTTSRDGLVLETLPYQARIMAEKGQQTTALRKITQMSGIVLPDDEHGDGDEEVADRIPAVGDTHLKFGQKIHAAHDSIKMQQANGSVSKARSTIGQSFDSTVGAQEELEQLYISDDDIQDD